MLLIDVKREMELSFSLELLTQSVNLAESKDCKLYLFDLSKVGTKDSVLNQYIYAQRFPETLFPHDGKAAAFAGGYYEDHRFMETLLRNVGVNVRFFHSKNEALTWLLG